jgi:putative Holliday junction resolvase
MVDAGTYLGFDFGMRRIGVAVGESITGSARPLATLPAREGQPDWDRIETLLRDWRPSALVVGLPRRLDGSDADITPLAERFARRLHGRFNLPVHTIDEQLSSHAAEQFLAGRGRGGRKLAQRRSKAEVDQLAAAIILETWFTEQPHA